MKERELQLLGKNIRRLRKSRGINQTILASEAGTRPTTISALENGINANPGWDLLERVAKALGTSIHELTQPGVVSAGTVPETELAPGLRELVDRQDEMLALNEPRISLAEVEWLSGVPAEVSGQAVSADNYLMILRHYRLITRNRM